MGWRIEFINRECEVVNLIINGELWVRHSNGEQSGVTWQRDEGPMIIPVPLRCREDHHIEVVAAAWPWGRRAEIRIFWGTDERQHMDFSKEEDKAIDAS